MQLERLEFEFDTGIDPLTGEKRPPVRAVSRPEDRFDLYYVAEDKRGHHCGEALSVSGGRIPCRLMDLDPSQDVYEILHRSWAVRNEWRVPARELVKKCDRLWRI